MTELPTIETATRRTLEQQGGEAWEEFRALTSHRHHLFIPCDYALAYETLRGLRSRAATFVELGAGVGVVTILADLLGFEAHGIEMEPWLVERARDLADEVGSRAGFVEGTFVPPDYQDEIEHLSSDFHTPTGGACAYDELGLELGDFDLVYTYPWPGDEEWLFELVRRHARPDALLLTYDAADGFRVSEGRRPEVFL